MHVLGQHQHRMGLREGDELACQRGEGRLLASLR